MGLKFAERVAETTTSTGDGPWVLAGNIAGYQAFSNVLSDGDQFIGTIEAINDLGAPSGDWTTAVMTYDSGGTVDVAAILDSSSGGAAVSFAVGTKRIMLAPSASLFTDLGVAVFTFLDRGLNTPPVSPANGDTYLVGSSPTGAWSTYADRVVAYLGTWIPSPAEEGMIAWVADENVLIIYDGAAWVNFGGSAYTDEMARDAIGAMLTDSTTIDVTYNDAGDAETFDVIHAALKPTETIILACSDETTAITTGTAKATFRMPYAFTLTAVRASVTTAPTGSTIIIDINESGSTILSTKLSIDASEKTSTTAASAAVISDTSLADDAEITIDFDQVGSSVAGTGVKVALIGHRT